MPPELVVTLVIGITGLITTSAGAIVPLMLAHRREFLSWRRDKLVKLYTEAVAESLAMRMIVNGMLPENGEGGRSSFSRSEDFQAMTAQLAILAQSEVYESWKTFTISVGALVPNFPADKTFDPTSEEFKAKVQTVQDNQVAFAKVARTSTEKLTQPKILGN